MKSRYLINVSTLKLDAKTCTGCGMCLDVCPHHVFYMDNKKAKIMNIDACMECGACAKNCMFHAIHVKAGVGCAYAIIRGWLMGSGPGCSN
jgi:NAD-dependent dihydropyrimidine dehydrogenase PreA subunit